ncbi:Cell division cycle-associated 7-like protein [Zea mays]|uniref:Zinc-finger domain of monoamine-oxidase A repressor R1 protein n=2 Tax=Zea mays TaxID=4577 RepID=A0A1D6Q2P5_MAIZE|nr:Zinc-finger domain of monoamine-oxidase A repressor R1 protein [Zea mays]AQK52857.1 Zinc-finger domain of monoamine-oxidase A repressor R1 protein [Zea mays]PWZ25978.1 Cell division cycle-associated 7-like protein [Zea mays]
MAAPPEGNVRLGEGWDEDDVLEPQPLEVIAPDVKSKKRNPAPGVRVVGRRIYDPENGKTCHQCRQKTTDFAAACKQVKKKGPCPVKYCLKCLLNRYGESAEEAAGKEDWICPKCRGICNCSFCRKKKGEMPTGIMAHIAKASGCTSVHDLLKKGSDVVSAAQAILKVNGSDKGTKRSRGTDAAAEVATEKDVNIGIDINTVIADEGDENIGVDLNSLPSVDTKKRQKRQKLKHRTKKDPADATSHGVNTEPLQMDGNLDFLNSKTVRPRGTPVTKIAGAELDDEDTGAAIQFIEFCRAFTEIFQIKKGQPEKILQDLVGGRELRFVSSVVAGFHINLLSVIQEGKGKKPLAYTRDGDAWVIDIGKYISESASISKGFPLNHINQGISGYKNLSPSCKLRVLNFLCDETLSTDKLRNWIDMQNDIAAEPVNAAREKARAAKEMVKELKERLKDNMNKIIVSPNEAAASNSEANKYIISQIKEAQEVKRAAINGLNNMIRYI